MSVMMDEMQQESLSDQIGKNISGLNEATANLEHAAALCEYQYNAVRVCLKFFVVEMNHAYSLQYRVR